MAMGKSEIAGYTPKLPAAEQNKTPEDEHARDNSARSKFDQAKGSEQAARPDKIAEAGAQAYAPGTDANANLGNRMRDSGKGQLPSFGIDFSSDKLAARLDKTKEVKTLDYKNPNMSEEGQALVRQAERAILKPGYPNAGKELLKFAQDVEHFEKQAKQNDISPEEVKRTYKGIEDLLKSATAGAPGVTGDGMSSERQRVRVAEQLMNMVAHPEDRNQGDSDTCAMATVEGMLLTGNNAEPSRVTRMVAEVALTGQTKVGNLDDNGSKNETGSKNEVTVKLDKQSMRSFGEHADNRPSGDERQRLAENIFRLTAANTYFAMRKQEGHTEGQLHYESGKNGNRLVYKRDESLPHDEKLAERNKPGEEISGPHEASTPIAGSRILNQITGKDYKERFLVNTNAEESDAKWTTGFSNAKELDDLLKKAKDEGKMPVTIGVFASNPLFRKGDNLFSEMDEIESEQDASKIVRDMVEDGHAILITDRTDSPLGAQYQIKNTWGKESNIKAWSHELFESTEQMRPTKLVDQLDKWHQGHKPDDKEHRHRFVASLLLTTSALERQAKELPNGGSPAHQRDLQSANLRMKAMYETLPLNMRREIERGIQNHLKTVKDPEKKATIQRTLDTLTK